MERKPFKFSVAGEDYKAKIGNTVVCLFREQPEIDYFKIIDKKNKEAAYLFNNQELARKMGGFVLVEGIHVPDSTFRDIHGWLAPTIIEDFARQYEVDLYIQANSHDSGDRQDWLA